MKSILDRSFHYTSSVQTDLKKTFARIRREKREQDRIQAEADADAMLKAITRSDSAVAISTRFHSGKP